MIPRIIHQIWLGAKPIPSQACDWAESYSKIMPDWIRRVWRDDDLQQIAGKLVCPEIILDPSVNMGLRCEVLRYEILRLYGGLYLDQRIEIFRPLDELMVEEGLHFASSFNSLDAVSNAMIACPAGHPFWFEFLISIKALAASYNGSAEGILQMSGSKALAPALHAWLGKIDSCREIQVDDGWIAGWLYEHENVIVWSREAVHPFSMSEKESDGFRREEYPLAYAAHHCARWMDSLNPR